MSMITTQQPSIWPENLSFARFTLTCGHEVTGQIRGYQDGKVILKINRKTTWLPQNAVCSWTFA